MHSGGSVGRREMILYSTCRERASTARAGREPLQHVQGESLYCTCRERASTARAGREPLLHVQGEDPLQHVQGESLYSRCRQAVLFYSTRDSPACLLARWRRPSPYSGAGETGGRFTPGHYGRPPPPLPLQGFGAGSGRRCDGHAGGAGSGACAVENAAAYIHWKNLRSERR
jgi:hypothetical protein